MPRTLALGDIHGCSAALATVLKAINLQSDDTLITLGDYIDRGPDSRGVIELLLPLFDRCHFIPLLGNHEIILLSLRERLDAFEFWVSGCGGAATLASYGGRLDRIPAAHWDFAFSLQRYHESATHLFLHANYHPQLPLAEQSDELLFWTHLFETPAPHVSGKRAIVGHTPQTEGVILDVGHLVCIDTWCFGHGCLTAMDVDSGDVWQADKGGVLLKEPR